MKKCTGCGIEKQLDDFYNHPATKDGKASKCKDCAKTLVKSARKKNAKQYAEYEKSRSTRPDRVAARAAYQKTQAGKESLARARKKYAQNSPKRRAAHVSLGNAIRDGKVVPWPTCSIIDCSKKPEAHHPDYDRPLDVVWLCKQHHNQAHSLFRSLINN